MHLKNIIILGCCILFDLLLHQKDPEIEETPTQEEYVPSKQAEASPSETMNGEVCFITNIFYSSTIFLKDITKIS